jgi:hypothetical protein
MADETASNPQDGSNEPESSARREALIKLGKYTAYATPVVLVSMSAAQGQPLSGTPAPPGPSSDVRLKRDIVLLNRLDSGIGLYRYRYLWSDTIYVGVMAQEVARVAPHAVSAGPDGYLRVDYTRLGMQLLTWDEWLRADAPMLAAA